MKIISHNSWSFAKPKKWWMKLINFTAKCQKHTVKRQCYHDDIRAFDLRIRFDKNRQLQVVHGYVVYDISNKELFKDLQYLNDVGGITVRLLHDIRTTKQAMSSPIEEFAKYARYYETMFPNITFFGGNNLYNGNRDYEFSNWFTIEGKYGSVSKPTWFWGICPFLYAIFHNKSNVEQGINKDFLMIDFVNIR